MEQIKNIEIRNFKSIRHAKIEDCRRINVFIGYPNVGKSNTLEALSLFSYKDNQPIFSSLIRSDGESTLFFNGSIDRPLEIIVNNKHRFKGNYSKDGLFLGYDVILNDNITFEDVRLFIEGGAEEILSFRVIDDRIEQYKKYVVQKEHSLREIKKYEFNKHVNYREGGYGELVAPFGDNIFDVLSSSESIRKDVSELFKRYDLRFSFEKATRSFKILKNVGEDIFLISYSMIADTLRRLIFYKCAISSNKDSILLFEEPEAHMFPPYISKFTGDVWYKDSNQYFISTHSPFVINDFMEHAKEDLAIYVLDYKDGETTIKRLTDDDLHEAYQYGMDLFLNIKSFT